ncbi:uncharacterized protein [Spinacia oleracea]|uniref:Uncharacterized protein isoform X3 n=1 Tax=Spinacia oleracea TaxID=3562 RepID=A0ABM3QGZ7_SPIOL|nr:uncharacterized protein LOC110793581 isoform X3 [Spinacia oleracea]
MKDWSEIFRGGNTCLFDLSWGRVLVQQSHHGHSRCSGTFASGVLEQDPPPFPCIEMTAEEAKRLDHFFCQNCSSDDPKKLHNSHGASRHSDTKVSLNSCFQSRGLNHCVDRALGLTLSNSPFFSGLQL